MDGSHGDGAMADDAREGIVLVVEDTAEIREVMALLLECEGYRVELARNGAEALAWLEAHGPPAAMLLDLMMPVVDGWAVLRALRAEVAWRGVPVTVCTAAEGDLPEGVPVLRKPVSPEALLERVRAMMELSCDRTTAATA